MRQNHIKSDQFPECSIAIFVSLKFSNCIDLSIKTLPFVIIHNKSPTTQISSRASIIDMRIFFALLYSVMNFMRILLLCCFVTLCNFSCNFYSIGTRFCTFCRSSFQSHKHPDCLKPPLPCCFSCCYNLYPVFLKLSI